MKVAERTVRTHGEVPRRVLAARSRPVGAVVVIAIADAETMGQDTLLALQSGLAHLSDLLTEAYFR